MLLSVWLMLRIGGSSQQGKPGRREVHCLDICCPADKAELQCLEPVLAASDNEEDIACS